MPDPVKKVSKSSPKSFLSQKSPAALMDKSSKSSSSMKINDSKRSTVELASKTSPRCRPHRTRRSSSGTSNSSSSDSDKSGSPRSKSPMKTAHSSKKADYGISLRPQDPTVKSDTSSIKQADKYPTHEVQKKMSTASKESDTKRAEFMSRQKAHTSATDAATSKHFSTLQATDEAVLEKVESLNSRSSRLNDEQNVEKVNKGRVVSPALPRFTCILIEKLTRNVNKTHVTEIFSVWGKILSVDMPPDRLHPEFSRSYAYVTYEDPISAADAVNFMNGGQIDGEVIRVTEVLSRSSLLMRGEHHEQSEDQMRGREAAKREVDRTVDGNRASKNDSGVQSRAVLESIERRGRARDDMECRREKQKENDRADNRDRPRERDRFHETRGRRLRRGSSGSPFAGRSGPSSNRARSPGGARYRRPSPPASRHDQRTPRRVRSRSPLPKPQASKPGSENKGPLSRRERKSSRSSSSSTSDSGTSNSSASSSRSGSSTSSSSSSSRSRS